MTDRLVMLVWTLRTWPKAQYVARALSIPPDAWEIPFLFAPLGGPEISVFEAMEKPELGGLTQRLRGLTKPLAAAAYTDPWIKSTLLAESKLALAFHPGVDAEQVQQMSTRDGYRVVDMATAMSERGDQLGSESLADEGLADRHAQLRAKWKAEGADDDALLRRTLALPVWDTAYHSAAFYLLSRVADWPRIGELGSEHELAQRRLRELVSDVAHPVLSNRLHTLSAPK
jgi:hypothetical protein